MNSFDDGEISEEFYKSQRDRLLAFSMEIWLPYSGLAKKLVSDLHGETFYDLGGAIRESQPYLILKSTEVSVRFRIHQAFKGEAAGSIELNLNSDMLAVPGEDYSRYAKRQRIREQTRSGLKNHLDRMDDLSRMLSAGAVSEQVFDVEANRVAAIEREYARETGLYYLRSDREVSSWLGKTFYEKGGVIRPSASYLIGVKKNPKSKDAYLLGELPESSSRIYWGVEAEDVMRELRELSRL